MESTDRISYFESHGRFVIDSEEDVANLPTKNIPVGSIAIVADTSQKQFIMNNARNWVEYVPADSGGGSGGGGGGGGGDHVDGDETLIIG